MWERKSYEGICPFKCKKYKAACDAIENLAAERKDLLVYRNEVESIVQVSDMDYQILGMEHTPNADFIVLMKHVAPSVQNRLRDIYLYRLPFHHQRDWLCHMDLNYSEGHRAYIIDWRSRYEDRGYGSILMKHLILFLKSAGFQRLTGVISAVDFDHEDKLRYFYGKFGFKITDYPDKRTLCLDFQEPQ